MMAMLVVLFALLAVVNCAVYDVPRNTAFGTSTNNPDLNWTVTVNSTKTSAVVGRQDGGWLAFTSYADWINPGSVQSGKLPDTDYVFTTSFELMNYDPAFYTLNSRISVDNVLKAVTVNGKAQTLTAPCSGDAFRCFTEQPLKGFVKGTNTIAFTVTNVMVPSTSPTNPVGLCVEFQP